jgi:poly(A) polymerase|tara:strand:+ start:1368 stop:2624 length:1257 start_codon:yes stop_codon:yes gene_type:complete
MKKIIKNLSQYINKYFFPFYNSKDIKLLFKSLEKNDSSNKDVAMFVGGCVRNYLLSKKIEDIDIATTLTPEELKKRLLNSKFKVIDTGLSHSSVTVVSKNRSYEFTTLRKDMKTDGRHAEIEMIDNWKEDSKRRDFTINAIYLNRKGKIFDPQQGINDLKNNIVKFIGDPQTRIEEDFLRIIRFLRFTIQYNSNIEPSTVKAIKINLNGIQKISKERILTELYKILDLDNFFKIHENKYLSEIFELIFPEFANINRLKNFNIIKKYFDKLNFLILATLLIDSKNNHEYFLHKYKSSKSINERLFLIGDNYKECKKDKEFFKKRLKINLYHLGKENIKILYCIYILEKNKISLNDSDFFNVISKISIPEFPYDGKYLINKGFKEGKKIGKILNQAEKIWIQKNFNLSVTEFEDIVESNS